MVKKKNIRLFKPSVGNEEILEIKKVFKRSWIGYGKKQESLKICGVNILRLNIQLELIRAQLLYMWF